MSHEIGYSIYGSTPVRHKSHLDCHCNQILLCESPPIEKRVSNCGDGCCSTKTTTIANAHKVASYKNALSHEHFGVGGSSMEQTLRSITHDGSNCSIPPPKEVDTCKKTTGYYHELEGCNCNSNTKEYIQRTVKSSCCARGSFNHNHCYGRTPVTIKEIPEANVFLINHEFIDLLVDEIMGCCNSNVSEDVRRNVVKYTELYYRYHKDVSKVGNLLPSDRLDMNVSLLTNEVDVARSKAVLEALNARVKGYINGNEQ